MVSAFAARQRLVLGQVKVAEKSNEIVAIPKLLDLLVIEGAIITIDAMGCQRDIAQKVVEKKADYVLALKGNQGSLREDVELFAAEQKAAGFRGQQPSVATKRWMAIMAASRPGPRPSFTTLAGCRSATNWAGLKAVVVIESERETGDKIDRETRFYLTSLSMAGMMGLIVPAATGRSRTAYTGCWTWCSATVTVSRANRSRARQFLYDQAHGAEPDPIGPRKGFPAPQAKDGGVG